jgi:DNA/RNA-binding domain of Phe-tRNA-synthetase-like protein
VRRVNKLVDQIDPRVHALYPSYSWGKVFCSGLDNHRSTGPADDLLRVAEAELRADQAYADVAQHPRIAAWRDAFSAFGARPSKYQSSVEALVRRARRGDELPAINLVVGLYNAISLRYRLPVGGDDLAGVVGGLYLRPADGNEVYHELGTGVLDTPPPGEIVYCDAEKVLCRRWCWRQGDDSKITEASRAVVLNIHGLPPVTSDEVAAAAAELAELVPRHAGGAAHWYVLDREHPCRETVLEP